MSVLSFVEESCWKGETLRPVRNKVVFMLNGWGLVHGEAVQSEFVADFGIFYDGEDEMILALLAEIKPEIEWGSFIFHRLLDHSGIMICSPTDGEQVGSIKVRSSRRLLNEDNCANVMSWDEVLRWKRERDERRKIAGDSSQGQDD